LTKKEETSRRLYTTQPPLYCGIDLHARTMSVCILDQHGEFLVYLSPLPAGEGAKARSTENLKCIVTQY
jgi:hypothetical protein